MKRALLLSLIGAGLLLLLSACAGTTDGIAIQDPWVRPSPMQAGNGAAYMIIENNGSEDDALIAASFDLATAVEIHETTMGEGDMMQMQPVESIVIPAGGSAELKPGGLHVMLLGLTENLPIGETVILTLTFENAGDIQIEAEVREQ